MLYIFVLGSSETVLMPLEAFGLVKVKLIVLVLHNLLIYRKGQRRHKVNATHHKHNKREYFIVSIYSFTSGTT